MTLTDKTQKGQTTSLAFELELNHPPERVWRALTDPALLAEWLLPLIAHKLEPGAAFTFKAAPQPGWDGLVHGRVLALELHKTLSYSWVVGDMDTVVTFTLSPTATGTRLSLTHTGFRQDQAQNFGGARYGWRMMGDKLIALLGRMA